jgi:hypothetical protein
VSGNKVSSFIKFDGAHANKEEIVARRLSTHGQKWLKCFHALAAGIWVGTGVSLATKQFFITPSQGPELFGILSTLDFVDLYILVPGAMGTLVTALIYSIWTNWGWFRHRWITVKWCICAFGIVFGTYPLGPWLSGMAKIAREQGMSSYRDAVFMHNLSMLMIFGTFQAATIVFAFFLSVLKPWKKKEKVVQSV